MQRILRRLDTIRTPKETGSESRGLSPLSFVAVISAVLIWRATLPLTLDESVTRWITSADRSDLIDRTVRFQGQSPLYFSIAALASLLPGPAELVLRLPSLLALFAMSAVLGDMARRLFGKEAGALACMATLLSCEQLFGADARPYALAILASCASSSRLLAWLETRNGSDARWFIAYSIAAFYLHYLFAGMLLVHAAWLASRGALREMLRYWRSFAIALLASLPGLAQFAGLSSETTRFSFAPEPELIDVLRAWLSPLIVLPLGIGVLAVFLLRRDLPDTKTTAAGIRRAAAWHLIPPLAIYLLSAATGAHLMVDRYYSWHVPAGILLIAAPLSGYSDRAKRIYTVVASSCLLFLGIAAHAGRPLEGWRKAAETIDALLDPAAPARVFAVTGLVEALSAEYFETPESRAYLIAPFVAYPPRAPVSPLPILAKSEPGRSYVSRMIESARSEGASVVLVIRVFQQPLCDHLKIELSRALIGAGFERVSESYVEGIELIVFSPPGRNPKLVSNPSLTPERASMPENPSTESRPL